MCDVVCSVCSVREKRTSKVMNIYLTLSLSLSLLLQLGEKIKIVDAAAGKAEDFMVLIQALAHKHPSKVALLVNEPDDGLIARTITQQQNGWSKWFSQYEMHFDNVLNNA